MELCSGAFCAQKQSRIRKETQNAEKYTKNFTSGTGKDNEWKWDIPMY